MSSDPGRESFFCGLRPIPRILILALQGYYGRDREKFRGIRRVILRILGGLPIRTQAPAPLRSRLYFGSELEFRFDKVGELSERHAPARFIVRHRQTGW